MADRGAIQRGDPAWQRIAYISLNWANTNKKGMLFGVLMGAVFLSMLKLLKRRSYRGGFSNSLIGMAIGAPLGVCVNCAAPIAKGIHEVTAVG